MHIVLTGLGSYGDVLPMVGLGAALRSRGHRATVVANPYFRDVVEQAGLELAAVGTIDEYVALTTHPNLWHPFRGPKLVLRYGSQYLTELYEQIEAVATPGETVLAAHGLDLASRTHHERYGTPLATCHFAPLALRTLYDTPRFFGLLAGTRTPRWMKRLQFYLADRAVIDPIVGPKLNALRATLGLPPVTRVYRQWHNSPQLVLGMWPDWFAARQPDWPDTFESVGFPLWDSTDEATLPAGLQQFLDDGTPPFVFVPGSANAQAGHFFHVAAEVCHRLDARAIFATKFAEQLPQPLPPEILHADFVPFSRLLPHARALVHHGGIGSSAQALATATPQLVMPMAYDQLDNAMRLERLGVASYVLPASFTVDRVEARLTELLSRPELRERCQELALRCDGSASLSHAATAIERLTGGHGPPPEVRPGVH